jgi:hypothetical protein
MDPQDHLRALPDGVICTVCEGHVATDRIRVLAWREDLAFLQIDCPVCRSTTLAFVMGEIVESDVMPPSPPISADDVLDMHELLEHWRGDLRSLVGGVSGRTDREADRRSSTAHRGPDRAR